VVVLNNKTGVLNAYIDFAKAFDVVQHNKLLQKLVAYGITGVTYSGAASKNGAILKLKVGVVRSH